MNESLYPNDYLPITYDMLIRFALMNNWDPVYHKKADAILTDEGKFSKILYDWDLIPGIPPKDHMIQFLRFAAKSFSSGFFITNFVYASYLEDDLNNIPESANLVTMIGEQGVGKTPFAKMIHDQTVGNEKPFITVDCSAFGDDDLCSLVFGTDVEGKYGIRGTKLALANHGSLYLKNLQSAGKHFQARLDDFLKKDPVLDTTAFEYKNAHVKIICSYEIDSEPNFDKIAASLDDSLAYSIFAHKIYLLPIERIRSDLPLLIFVLMLKLFPRLKLDFNSIEIPDFLLRYWILYRNWSGNYHELQHMLTVFLENYSRFNIEKGSDRKAPIHRSRIYSMDDESKVDHLRYGKPDTYDNKEIADYIFDFEQPEINEYLEQLSFYNVTPIYLFDLMGIPFLEYLSQIKDPKDRKPTAKLSDYHKFSPFGIKLSFDFGETDKRKIDTEKIIRVPESSAAIKYDKNDIEEIIVEVFKQKRDFPRIKFALKGGSDLKEIKYNPKNQIPQVSFLIFLIYERNNIDDNGNPRNPNWGVNWLVKRCDLNFEPIIDVCRWLRLVDKEDRIIPPSWWMEPENTYPIYSRIGDILEENDVDRKIIRPFRNPGYSAIYHIIDGIKAKIDIK